MKRFRSLLIITSLMLYASVGMAQLGNLKNAGKKLIEKAASSGVNLEQVPGASESPVLNKVATGAAIIDEVKGEKEGARLPVGVISTEPRNIIFSTSPLNPDSPSGMATEFKAGDYLYAVAYLEKPLKEYYPYARQNDKLKVTILFYEVTPGYYEHQPPREMQIGFATMSVSGDLKNASKLVIELIPDPSSSQVFDTPGISWDRLGKRYKGPVDLAESLAKLGSGNHTITVKVNSDYGEEAAGTFQISGDDFGVYNQVADQLNELAHAAGTANAEFPAAVVSDKPREARMVAALTGSKDWKTGFVDGTEVLKTAIVYDWEIRRHALSGAILNRYCVAAIAFKTKSGGCAYHRFTFKEEYVSGQFQPLKLDGVGEKVTMNCDKLSK